MAKPKHPRHEDSFRQQEKGKKGLGGPEQQGQAHPRDTDTQNPERPQPTPPKPGEKGRKVHGAGKHYRDAAPGGEHEAGSEE